MCRKFTTYLLVVLLLLSGVSVFAQTNTALSFNGATSDYATTNPGTFFVPTSGADMTVELWAYIPISAPTSAPFYRFLSEGFSGSEFAIGYNSTNYHLYLGDSWTDVSGATLTPGQWNHIAITQDAVFDVRVFLNGVQVDSIADQTASFAIIANGMQTQFGTDVDNSTFFTGAIDQFRVWDYLRTPAQIKAGMYGNVDSTSAGLTVDFLFDANPGYTHNSGNIGNADAYLQGSTTTITSPVQPGNNGVRFTATDNTKITAPGTSTLDLAVGTVEAYVNPSSTNGTIVNLGSDASHTRFSIHLNNTGAPATHSISIRNTTGGTQGIFYPAGFTTGNWYQLAFVTNHGASNDTTGVYVNGNYVGVLNTGYDATVGTSRPLTIGANGFDNLENWNGSIDEVRIWNVPLTQSDIVANLTSTLTGQEPNLAALYSFDQGIPDGDNTGMTLTIDNSPQTNNATLSNFSLSSTNSNFTAHLMVPLPITLLQFTATKQSNTSVLQWQTGVEQNSRDFIIERSSNGADYDQIGTVAAAGTSNTKRYYYFTDYTPLEGKNYYRLRQRDLDGKSTLSPVKVVAFSMAGNLIWYSTGSNAAEVRLHNGNNEPYTITDMAGSLIRAGRLSSGVTSLSQMPSGIYFVKVVTNAGNEITVKVLLK
jgi:hypothetical protein